MLARPWNGALRVFLAILVLIWFDLLTLNLLALIGFVAVCGTVVYSVAAPSLVPSLVPAMRGPFWFSVLAFMLLCTALLLVRIRLEDQRAALELLYLESDE